ncbi:MAG: protein-L-isoaspartate O-methyltransferase [Alphaproteobacteria bacterium]|uniref:protein-L-isoaspartate O-methyltransferase family protein n=1 Tax=Maricaulis alexandrii TaxID=2570354 RepID=UPI001108E9FD|nr:protein-L-isoaspartate O-methyltransferase [Maricaulis alexandrii]MCR9267394.1 protein-L-isoaspartate O-methyltransferase [Alphaproteobacteria bacterium]
MSEFDQARKHMVDSQIRPSDVTDRRLIAAFLNTPRELFVPRSRRASAYADSQVVTSDNRTLMRPRDMAKLIHAADIQPGDIVLDIANGRGYSTAILACMAETVVGVENDEDGLSRSSTLLSDIGADNAVVVEGDPKAGVPKQGPFDVIFVNGSVDAVPTAWFDQLADGGRLVVIVRKGPVGKATVFTKSSAGIGERVVFDANATVLPGFEAEAGFAF